MFRLKEIRKKKSMSQQELADYLGVTQATLSGWENEKYEIDNASLLKCADYFHVTVDYLLGRSDELPDTSVTLDDFTIALYNATKHLTTDQKQQLINMANFFNSELEKNKQK
ncbi:MAG: helix-turn-helix transcriptional regulator [Clostridia bacterium]|nr:helix-turn-helix transcriptional regulator [Clostridia bacterium]